MQAPQEPNDRLLGARAPTLAAHRARYPLPPAPRRGGREDVIAAVEHAGLLGRGGGWFPTGRKLAAVVRAAGRRHAPIVVVNGAEGEPASAKDATLLQQAPHLVLDGAQWAAAAVGASSVVVALDRTATTTARALEQALQERAGERSVPFELAVLPPRYVAGEEHALVSWINGGLAKPTYGRVYEAGVAGAPTLVDNVETLAHLAQIACFGPEWFRRIGTANEPGTMLCTVTGAVTRSRVVFEVPIGLSLGSLVRAAGGATEDPQAVLLGGYYGTWLARADLAGARLENGHLQPLGAGLGCGAVVVLGASSCGVVESARVLTWLAGESAGQCGPCVHGLAAIAGGMRDLATGHADAATIGRLHRWADQVEHRGACSFPDGAVRFLRSALRAFASDADAHARGVPCDAARRPPVLSVPPPRDARDPRQMTEAHWR
jgi:NADH:ubiquinone oxidoreductase subunit F (NADH-binding)